jgi:cell division protein FtsQ
MRAVTKWTLAVGVVVTGLAFGTQWALHSSYLRVQHVEFVGLHHETETAVLAASGLASHPTMLSVDDANVAAKLASFTWIDRVQVTKHWPNTLVVHVQESTAVAVAYNPAHALEYVDRAGRALGPAPTNANLPTLVYFKVTAKTWPFARAGRHAALVASALPHAFAAQVSVISVDAKGNVTLRMTTPVSFYLGEPVELHQKFVAIASVIAHTTLTPGSVVNVTVPDELAVTPPATS